MKNKASLLLILGLMVFSMFALSSQTATADDNSLRPNDRVLDPTPYTLSKSLAPVTLTQSVDPATITALNSVSCNNGSPDFFHADNSYFRRFDLDAMGVSGMLGVESVDIGIETALGATGSQAATVNLYSIGDGVPLTFANLGAPVGTANVTVVDQSQTVVNFTVAGTVNATDDLVVEFFTPDGQTVGNQLFIGTNAAGQTAPTFLSAAACGITEPSDTATIGFPNMHWVLTVHGNDTASAVTLGDIAVTPSTSVGNLILTLLAATISFVVWTRRSNARA